MFATHEKKGGKKLFTQSVEKKWAFSEVSPFFKLMWDGLARDIIFLNLLKNVFIHFSVKYRLLKRKVGSHKPCSKLEISWLFGRALCCRLVQKHCLQLYVASSLFILLQIAIFTKSFVIRLERG